MKRLTHKTRVQFLVHTDDSGQDIFAYFPCLSFDKLGNKTAYSLIGQHSACSPDYAKECRKATKEEYRELKNELETHFDYKLLIID